MRPLSSGPSCRRDGLAARSVRARGRSDLRPARLHEMRIVMDPADWSVAARRTSAPTSTTRPTSRSTARSCSRSASARAARARAAARSRACSIDMNKLRHRARSSTAARSSSSTTSPRTRSFLHEPLSYAVFEAMGIAAPADLAHAPHRERRVLGRLHAGREHHQAVPGGAPRRQGGQPLQVRVLGVYDFSYRGAIPAPTCPRPSSRRPTRTSLDATGLVAFIRTVERGAATPASWPRSPPFLDVDQFLTHVAVENAIAETRRHPRLRGDEQLLPLPVRGPETASCSSPGTRTRRS